MAVIKFNLKQEYYDEAIALLDEINNTRTINGDQLKRLHGLVTKCGYNSSPGGCASCNRKALNVLKGFIHQYENPE
jgi:hypothetical protein